MLSTSNTDKSRSARRLAVVLFNTVALTLALTFALPAHADGRVIKQRFSPVYPEIAKRMRVGGIVKLEVAVAADGSVVTVKTVSGNRMLSNAAEEAVKKWRFAPGADGTTEEVDVNFALSQ